MKKLLIATLAVCVVGGAANAAMQTVAGVSFDDGNSVVEAKLAAGLPPGEGAAGRNHVGDDIDEVEGFDLSDSYQLRNNGTFDDDVLSLLFANALTNGAGNCAAGDYAGCDLLIFEVLNQPDSPTLSVSLGGSTILGVLLGQQGSNATHVAVWGFDLALLGVMVGDPAANPLYVGRDAGTPDIAAAVGVNFIVPDPMPEIPLPAAAPLFFAGLAGLGFARGRRRKL